MNPLLKLIPSNVMLEQAATEIINCNEITTQYGLKLSQQQAKELVHTRTESLKRTGRVEFMGGVLQKIITVFCDSPFLSQTDYASVLNELIETFYYFKNETLDELEDDELIEIMKRFFDETCRGSVELLQNRELEAVARNIRYGIADYLNIHEDEEEYIDE